MEKRFDVDGYHCYKCGGVIPTLDLLKAEIPFKWPKEVSINLEYDK